MKKLLVIKSTWQIIEALIFIALGVVAIIFSQNNTFWKVIGYVCGALLALDGLLRLVLYFLSDNPDAKRLSLVICIGEVTLAIFIFVVAEVVVGYLALLIAVLLIVVGFVAIIDSIVRLAKKAQKVQGAILCMVGAAAILALGITALCFFPSNPKAPSGVNTISVMLIVLGVLTILGGVAEAIYTFVFAHKVKKLAKEANSKIAKEREAKREAK